MIWFAREVTRTLEQDPTIPLRQAPPHTFAWTSYSLFNCNHIVGTSQLLKALALKRWIGHQKAGYFSDLWPRQSIHWMTGHQKALPPPMSGWRWPRSGGRSRSQELPPRIGSSSASMLSNPQVSAEPAHFELIWYISFFRALIVQCTMSARKS